MTAIPRNSLSPRTLYGVIAATLLLALIFFSPLPGNASEIVVKIGVLAKRGPQRCLEQWGPTATYLNQHIPGYSFRIVPLDFHDIEPAVRSRNIDFLLTNSGIYVEMEAYHNISRIATMINRSGDNGYTLFGGVIFARQDRHDISDFESLKGKTFMGVDETSLGGWIMAWRELVEQGINPRHDFSRLLFGGTHDGVVYAVRDGRVDAGTIRTDTLERMAQEEKISLRDFKVLPSPTQENPGGDNGFRVFPYLRSTRLYPEWPMAKLPHTSEKLAKQVVTTLFTIEPASPAAKAGAILGWTIPLDYQEVHNAFKTLHIGPYKDLGKVSPGDVLRIYWHWIVLVLSLCIMAILATIYFRNLSTKLKKSESELRIAHAELDHIFSNSGEGIRIIDNDFNVHRVNKKLEELMELDAKTALAKKCYETFNGPLCHTPQCTLVRIRADQQRFSEEIVKTNCRGKVFDCIVSAMPFYDKTGILLGVVEQFADISQQKENEEVLRTSLEKEKQLSAELEAAYTELKETQAKILQQEKMATIGQLAAGVAHEINNPVGYIMSNMGSLQKYQVRLAEYIGFVEEVLAGDDPFAGKEAILAKRKQLKIDYIIEDCKDLIAETQEGTNRVKTIVANLKSFSRVDQKEYAAANLNDCIESTLNIVWNELKYKCTVDKQYGEIPPTYCYPQQLNQVVMNLLVNAAHAIDNQGTITIRTWEEDSRIFMTITDTGCGIPQENLTRIFEPFFTTKEVGKGTGLGLSIVYDIIQKHHGNIDIASTLGAGTTFTIELPVISSPPEPQDV